MSLRSDSRGRPRSRAWGAARLSAAPACLVLGCRCAAERSANAPALPSRHDLKPRHASGSQTVAPAAPRERRERDHRALGRRDRQHAVRGDGRHPCGYESQEGTEKRCGGRGRPSARLAPFGSDEASAAGKAERPGMGLALIGLAGRGSGAGRRPQGEGRPRDPVGRAAGGRRGSGSGRRPSVRPRCARSAREDLGGGPGALERIGHAHAPGVASHFHAGLSRTDRGALDGGAVEGAVAVDQPGDGGGEALGAFGRDDDGSPGNACPRSPALPASSPIRCWTRRS